MTRPPPQAYLLRLWREHQGAPLRATLVPVGKPEAQQHFADLDSLHAFLCAQAGQESGEGDNTPIVPASKTS
jgi:hypothetical protein